MRVPVGLRSLGLDPWEWPDLDELEQGRLLGEGNAGDPSSRFNQYGGVRRCNRMRKEVEAGSGYAVLACIRICGTHGLKLPDWLSAAYNARFDAVDLLVVKSWDDPKAFGSPHPKGVHLSALKKERIAGLKIWLMIHQTLDDHAVGAEFYEAIGREFLIGKTLTEKLFKATIKTYGLHDPVEARRRDARPQDGADVLVALATLTASTGRDTAPLGKASWFQT